MPEKFCYDVQILTLVTPSALHIKCKSRKTFQQPMFVNFFLIFFGLFFGGFFTATLNNTVKVRNVSTGQTDLTPVMMREKLSLMLDEYADRCESAKTESSRCKHDKHPSQFKNLINFLFSVISVKIPESRILLYFFMNV